MREVLIRVWCDLHPHIHEATGSYTVTVNGTPPRRVDLCDLCYKELIAPVVDLLVDYGVDPDAEAPPKRRRRATPATPNELPDAYPVQFRTCRYPVPDDDGVTVECGHVAATRHAYGSHLGQAHGTGIKAEIAAGRALAVPMGRQGAES